ncbi:MAG TPA: hypothetical protein VLH19_04165, partial [Patescibacteria group bacterium]|nr:hypothetical protein [Patescibacteria group bacterium]
MRNHWILLTINIAIIVAVEASGSFFANSGLIHLIAVFFVILGLTRIWTHKDVYDRFLVPLIHSGIIGMLILALSHIFEYISFRIGLPHATVSANVVNAYMLTFLFITIGAESFLIGLHRADSKISISAASILALIFSGLFAVFFYF